MLARHRTHRTESWIAVVSIVASLCGCSSSENTDEPSPNTNDDAGADSASDVSNDAPISDAPIGPDADAAMDTSFDATDSGPADVQQEACTGGETVCSGTVFSICGDPSSAVDCADSGLVCVPALGCVVCEPGTGTCSTDHATWCRSDGSGYIEFVCDGALGLACNASRCEGACSPANTEGRYVGCEYFPVTAINDVNNNYDFEVAVANAQSQPAHVTIEGGGLTVPLSVTVAAGGVERIPLPWVEQVKVCNETSLGNGFDQINACSAAHNPDYSSRVVPGGAYRVASDRPVAVYQFAPIQASKSGFQAGTTEASLLLPQTVLGRSYRVATYGQGFARGAIVVVATVDDTTITVHPTADVTPGAGNPAGIAAGGAGTYTANRGDAVEIISASAGASSNVGDLTGTLVEADHPIQVLGVHGCAWVNNTQSCDHLEDIMLPDYTLGTEHIIKASTYPGSVGYVARFVATTPGTTLTFEPPVAAPQLLAAAGDTFDLTGADVAVQVIASNPLLVAGLNQGDNTLSAIPPAERYLTDYLFYSPEFQNNYVKLLAPDGATIQVDGTDVPASAFTAIGASGWGWAIVSISSGPHRATAPQRFGLAVYGNQAAGYIPGGLPSAYEYPGGLDLR